MLQRNDFSHNDERISRSGADRVLDVASTVGLALLIVTGFVTSYATLRDLAVDSGGYAPWLAPAVPLSLDLGIVVLSLRVLGAARLGRRALVLRGLVALLSVGTVAANALAAQSPLAAVLHSAPPAMFVICFETVVVASGGRAAQLPGEEAQQISWARWIVAPAASVVAWRARVLVDGATDRSIPAPTMQGKLTPVIGAPRGPSAHETRAATAAEYLRDQPSITAAQLAARMSADGYTASLRSAQRWKQQHQTAHGRARGV
jgi:hypothetical protein